MEQPRFEPATVTALVTVGFSFDDDPTVNSEGELAGAASGVVVFVARASRPCAWAELALLAYAERARGSQGNLSKRVKEQHGSRTR
jgi:hypothetical protein